jgi:hypothetical protein
MVHTRVAAFTPLASGNWRVQVRRKTRYVAETFRRRKDGEEWALEMERNIDRNERAKSETDGPPRTNSTRSSNTETNRRQFIPMGRIVRYAVATTAAPDVDIRCGALSS